MTTFKKLNLYPWRRRLRCRFALHDLREVWTKGTPRPILLGKTCIYCGRGPLEITR